MKWTPSDGFTSHLQAALSRQLIPIRARDWALAGDCRKARFICIPKFHKQPMKARPIMNMRGSMVQNCSVILGILLNPVCSALPSTVASSQDFLRKADHSIPEGARLVVADVDNLYPSMQHDHVLEVVGLDLYRHFAGGAWQACWIFEVAQRLICWAASTLAGAEAHTRSPKASGQALLQRSRSQIFTLQC